MSERIDNGWYPNGIRTWWVTPGLDLSERRREVRYCHWPGCHAEFYITNERNKKYCDEHATAAKARTQARATAAAKARKAAGR